MLPNTIYLDLETTGLNGKTDEVVQIALLSDASASDAPLLNTLVRPVRTNSWPEAENVHGISPRMVRAAPTMAELTRQIADHLRGQHVVIYNAPFDRKFIPGEISGAREVSCCMRAAANAMNGGRWMKLELAAARIGYTIENAHDALSDILATRAIWRYLHVPSERRRIDDMMRQRTVAYAPAHEPDDIPFN